MKKIIILLAFSISLFANNYDIDLKTVNEINFYEKRSPLNKNLKELLENQTVLSSHVVSLNIPPVLNTDVSCGGFTANIGDVIGVIQSQLNDIAKQIPTWLAQEVLGVPLDSPAEMIRMVIDFMIQGYCWADVAGVQTVHSAAETSLDYASRLFDTNSDDEEKATGTTNLNGNTDLPANSHETKKKMSKNINQNAAKQSAAETTSETSKEMFKKVSECVKSKKDFIAEVLDMRVKKFKPLAHTKKQYLKSACQIIKEKGKRTNLNDEFNIPGKIYSPIHYNESPDEEILELKNGLMILKRSKSAGAVNAFINSEKLNKFFKNDLKIRKYKFSGSNLDKSSISDLSVYILNAFIGCLNNPDSAECKSYQNSSDFFLDFSKKPEEIKGLQQILLRKQKLCSVLSSYKYNLEPIRKLFGVITEYNNAGTPNTRQTKVILEKHIENTFCGVDFKNEVDDLEIFLKQKIKNEYLKISKNYALVLSQLKAFSVLNSFVALNNQDDLQKVCAFFIKKDGKSQEIWYYTKSNGIEKAKDVKELESKFNIKINNKFAVVPVKMNLSHECVYDQDSSEFKKMYEDYKELNSKKVVKTKIASKDKYSKMLLEERQSVLLDIGKLNSYNAEIQSKILLNVLKTNMNNLLIKLRL